MVDQLSLICDVCGQKEYPSDQLLNKFNENQLNANEIPTHCSETMRLTFLESKLKNELSGDLKAAIWIISESFKVRFSDDLEILSTIKNIQDALLKLGEKISINDDLTDLQKLDQLKVGSLNIFEEITKEIDIAKINVNKAADIIEKIISGIKNRANQKREFNRGPILPGTDPSFDISYFCQVCKQSFQIPGTVKQELLNSDEDEIDNPIHHDKRMEIRIIGGSKPVKSNYKTSSTEILGIFEGEDVEFRDIQSVGIDVGSSTSHLIFSKLKLKKEIGFMNMTGRYNVIKRDIQYLGKIINTPLIDPETINIEKLALFFQEEYKSAGFTPSDIDTGVVIVTGETAKKHNAAEIVQRLSEETGKFVSATAGPNFESLLGALGSGIVARSRTQQNTILGIDIGGGTSNMAIASKGSVISTACINIGGRLLGIDKGNEIWRIDSPTEFLFKELGMQYSIGDIISENDIVTLANEYAKALIESISGSSKSNITEYLMMTEDLDFSIPINEISFSGGIAELIYSNEASIDLNPYDDIGYYLAKAINQQIKEANLPVIEPDAKIRATVIGAGSFSLSVSGSTTYFDKEIQFPLTNIPAIPIEYDKKEFTIDLVANKIQAALKQYDFTEGEDMIALYFADPIYHAYRYLPDFAKSIEKALPNSIAKQKLIILLFGQDMGSLLGITMKEITSIQKNLLCLDELDIKIGDWIDIGVPLKSSKAFPVTIKSLIFNDARA